MTESLLLTDEEVVALAARHDSAWPGGIPTADGTESAVREAVFRGDRSLYVRGLRSDDGGLTPGLADLLDAVLNSHRRIVGYLGDADYQRDGWGMASAHYAAADDWVFEAVNPLGIHEFVHRPRDEHRSYMETSLQAALDGGPDQLSGRGDSPAWFCLLADTPEGGLIAAARRGDLRLAELEGDGEGEVSVVRDDPVECVGVAVERLLGLGVPEAAGRVLPEQIVSEG